MTKLKFKINGLEERLFIQTEDLPMKKRKNELKKTGELAEEILVLDKLAKILRKNRIKNGAITFDRSEVRFNLDENNEPIGVYFKISKDSNHLIEEFMLLANRKVSEFVSLTRKGETTGNTFVYRVHDDPNPTKLEALREFVGTF